MLSNSSYVIIKHYSCAKLSCCNSQLAALITSDLAKHSFLGIGSLIIANCFYIVLLRNVLVQLWQEKKRRPGETSPGRWRHDAWTTAHPWTACWETALPRPGFHWGETKHHKSIKALLQRPITSLQTLVVTLLPLLLLQVTATVVKKDIHVLW